MADDSMQYYCIKEPRCRLCQFMLEDGEYVVAAVRDNHVSVAFPFRRHDTFADEEEEITFHMCCESLCTKRDHQVLCFHDECDESKLFMTTPKLFAATEYSFSPPIREELQRRVRIQHTLATKLNICTLSQLPQELCYMVAGYLVRQCATLTAQELALDVCATDSLVDLSRDVYAQCVRIEGVLYVQSLYNTTSSEVRRGEVRVFKAHQGRVVRSIHIRYDYLGIRGIWFTLPNNDLSHFPVCGVWWTELSREGGILQVATKTDGLKLRCLLDSTNSTSSCCDNTMPAPGWPTPGLTCRVMDLDKCKSAQGTLNGLRMSFFDCNRPDIEGYSAAICGFHISKLYANHPGTPARLYEELDSAYSDLIWLYMPIDQGECLEEIWGICAGAGLLAFMLLTSAERAITFGPYITHPRIQFHRLYTTSSQPSRIYFNEWDPDRDVPWIKYLGIDTNAETDISMLRGKNICRGQYPPSLIPALPPPYTQYNELWYYTHCRMGNVTEITCCVNKTSTYKPIIGMLLRYKNGSRSCLGQYRLDWAVTPFEIDPARGLRIGLGETVKRFLYVAKVNGEGLTDPESIRWIDIPCHGRLEWWFSPRQCKLRHFD